MKRHAYGLRAWKNLRPHWLRATARNLYHRVFPATVFARAVLWDAFTSLRRDVPPIPPALLRYKVSEQFRVSDFLAVGKASADRIAALAVQFGVRFSDQTTVLDFGCGCARTLRWLRGSYSNVRWIGVDTDQAAIEWSTKNLTGIQFLVGNPTPPLPLESHSVDMIFGISVFTHLDAPSQDEWIAEFGRLHKPGGILILSFYSSREWASLSDSDKIRNGDLVFHISGKLSGLHPAWYQTAFQSRDRIERNLSAVFGGVTYLENGLGAHDVAVAQQCAEK